MTPGRSSRIMGMGDSHRPAWRGVRSRQGETFLSIRAAQGRTLFEFSRTLLSVWDEKSVGLLHSSVLRLTAVRGAGERVSAPREQRDQDSNDSR